MRIVFTLFAAAAVAVATPALAGERASHDEDAPQAEDSKADKKICRRIATDMSSRRQERVCLTAEEWRQRNRGN